MVHDCWLVWPNYDLESRSTLWWSYYYSNYDCICFFVIIISVWYIVVTSLVIVVCKRLVHQSVVCLLFLLGRSSSLPGRWWVRWILRTLVPWPNRWSLEGRSHELLQLGHVATNNLNETTITKGPRCLTTQDIPVPKIFGDSQLALSAQPTTNQPASTSVPSNGPRGVIHDVQLDYYAKRAAAASSPRLGAGTSCCWCFKKVDESH